MKAPRSRRSTWLGRACLWLFVAGNVSGIVEQVVGMGTISNQHHRTLFFSVGLPLIALWVASGLAYTVSRLNDAWAEEYRERRAAARTGLPLPR